MGIPFASPSARGYLVGKFGFWIKFRPSTDFPTKFTPSEHSPKDQKSPESTGMEAAKPELAYKRSS